MKSCTFSPQPKLEALEVGLDGNRIYRAAVEPGTLTISYRATVDLRPDVVQQAEVTEAARTQIPPTCCLTPTPVAIVKVIY